MRAAFYLFSSTVPDDFGADLLKGNTPQKATVNGNGPVVAQNKHCILRDRDGPPGASAMPKTNLLSIHKDQVVVSLNGFAWKANDPLDIHDFTSWLRIKCDNVATLQS